MSSTVLPRIAISDVPANKAKDFKGLGIVTKIEHREVANGFTQVTVVLEYNREDGSTGTFYARWNVRPEWFNSEYTSRVKSGDVQGAEKTQYDINMSGLTRGVCAAAGLEEIDIDPDGALIGKQVGFKTKNRKDDPSRLDISYFFAPKRS